MKTLEREATQWSTAPRGRAPGPTAEGEAEGPDGREGGGGAPSAAGTPFKPAIGRRAVKSSTHASKGRIRHSTCRPSYHLLNLGQTEFGRFTPVSVVQTNTRKNEHTLLRVLRNDPCFASTFGLTALLQRSRLANRAQHVTHGWAVHHLYTTGILLLDSLSYSARVALVGSRDLLLFRLFVLTALA